MQTVLRLHPVRYLLGLLGLAAIAVLIASTPIDAATAAVPNEINFQGLLLDSNGIVVNGTVDLAFEIFDAATSGNSLWSESHFGVSVFDGVYDVALGSTTPIDASMLSGGNVWLEISVDAETLAPRQRLLAVPFALRASEAGHATSADVAATTGSVPQGALDAIYTSVSFDGGDPPNDDPREGLADTDNDGTLNFLDFDNDGDGVNDTTELGNGTDINLVTPQISGFSPPTLGDIVPTTVTVSGSGFLVGLTVQVGAQVPTPSNITATSFTIDVNPESPSTQTVTATNPNAEQDTASVDFVLTTPTISSISPAVITVNDPVTLQVTGSNFLGALTVTFDGSPVTPNAVTSNSFSIDVVAPALETSAPVVVTLSNAESASLSVAVASFKRVFTTSTFYTGLEIGGLDGGDARCNERAAAASLTGTYRAWLADSTGDPATRFTPSALPYRRVDGVQVANDFTDLIDGTLSASPNVDEFGGQVNKSVWTNVSTNGTTFGSNSCSDWSSTAGTGRVGSSLASSAPWTSIGDNNCTTPLPLYCFEQ